MSRDQSLITRLAANLPAAEAEEAPAGLPLSAVAVLLRGHDDGTCADLLLIRRAERDGDLWSGHIALPGGRVEAADASLAATAARETHEEVGVVLDPGDFIGALPAVLPRNPKSPTIGVYPFVWRVPGDIELQPNEEVAEAQWVSLRHLAAPESATTFDYEHPALDAPMRVPAITIGDHNLWGITLRVVRSLLAAADVPAP